jgi:hypothetical protein
MPVIPALGRPRQDDYKFKTSLGETLSQNNKRQNKTKKP